MDQSGKSIGEFLRNVMEKQNLSILEISEWSGMDSRVIEELLMNRQKMTTEIAFRLSQATEISENVWCTLKHQK